MFALGLVSEIMIDDMELAEQLRGAVTNLWLLERRARIADLAWVVLREMPRAERQLRLVLQKAMQAGRVDMSTYERLMRLVRQMRRQPVRQPARLAAMCLV